MAEVKGIHVLVPGSYVAKLRQLAHNTRIHQSEYLREFINDLLAKHQNTIAAGPGPVLPDEPSANLVFRISPTMKTQLDALTEKTRIRQSEWLREALHYGLAKYGHLPSIMEDMVVDTLPPVDTTQERSTAVEQEEPATLRPLPLRVQTLGATGT